MREELSGVLVSCVWEIEGRGSEEGAFSFWMIPMSRMVAAKSSAIRKIRFNRTFGLIEQMNMDGVLPSKSILWFLQKLVGIR